MFAVCSPEFVQKKLRGFSEQLSLQEHIDEKQMFLHLFPFLIQKLEVEDIIEIYTERYLELFQNPQMKYLFYMKIGHVLYTAQKTYKLQQFEHIPLYKKLL